MSEPFIGEIRMVGFTYNPRGWALCNGQLISISSNEALFALLGTTYGGDGRSTFGLPDLRGRAPIHQGSGPGLQPINQGSKGGSQTTTLAEKNLPPHSHALVASAGEPNTSSPNGAALAHGKKGTMGLPDQQVYDDSSNPSLTMKSSSIGSAGRGESINNMMPYLAVNFVIALQGIFPPRD